MHVLFDIGGTHTRIATSEDGSSISDPIIFPTSQNYEEGIVLLEREIKKLCGSKKINNVAGGFAGILNKEKSISLHAPNLREWEGKPLASELQKICGAPVSLENDAALAALGEATYGAGKNFSIVAYLTISTGVGGARIINKKIDAHVLGFEPGHQIIDPGSMGDLESFVSGTALVKRYKQESSNIRDEKIWDEWAKILAVGIHNTIAYWSPDVVVLGGSVLKNPMATIARIVEHLKKMPQSVPEVPELLFATLGERSGLYGALVRSTQSPI